MKSTRVLLRAVGAVMCVISILLFTRPINVFDRVDQLKSLNETQAPASSPVQEAPHLAPAEIVAQQAGAPTSPPLQGDPRPAPAEIAPQQPEPPVASPLHDPHLAPAGIEQQQDQLDELHLDPPAQNSPHAIAPVAGPAAAETAPATQSESPATAKVIEVPSSPVESPSPAAREDEFVTITSAAGVHTGPSASADIIGRAYAGARARVASRDAGWAQIVDPVSGNTGWVDSRLLVPSPTTETASTEDALGEAPDGAQDSSA